MDLRYSSGEEIRSGDIVLNLTPAGGMYHWRQPVMKVWDIVKTNAGEVIGVSLIHPEVESPAMFCKTVERPNHFEPLPEVMLTKDVPELYWTTRWLVNADDIAIRLGLIGRIEHFEDIQSGHGLRVLNLIDQRAGLYPGIYQHFQAQQARIDQDHHTYIDLLRKSAASSFSPAMCTLAQEFSLGTVLQRNYEGTRQWLLKAVERKDKVGLYMLAECYAQEGAVPQDFQQSLKLLEQAAQLGSWPAVMALAGYCRFGWLTEFLHSAHAGYRQANPNAVNAERALQLYLKIARQAPDEELGNMSNAAYQLGWMYQDGIGTGQDYERSVYWYQKAADKDHIIAINNLADKYENGTGVVQDLEKAAALYMKAAGRVVAADLSLGRMYLDGRGVEQDAMKAKEHLNVVLQARISGIEAMQAEAAQLLAQFTQDSPLQQAEYALNHAASYSIDQISAEIRNIDSLLHMPEVKALFFKLFLLNAQKGDAASQSQVGDWYLRGIYTEKNLEEAAYWIQKAADQKNYYAEYQMGYLYENGLYFNQNLALAQKWYERALRKPSESMWPEYVAGQLNPEYLSRYGQMNKEALAGLARIEEKTPKPSKWRFWKK